MYASVCVYVHVYVNTIFKFNSYIVNIAVIK